METYVILRRSGWRTREELEATVERSIAEGERTPDSVRWLRSYVFEESHGWLGTVCIYEASTPEAIRDHAQRARLPVDEIVGVTDMVVQRPDPEPVEA